MPLRVVFFGTPGFAVPTLLALLRSPHQVAAVVTQPDRPRGRGHKIQAEAVKRTAAECTLPVWQPERLKDPAFLDRMAALDADVGVVAAYGRLLPQPLIDLPRLGMLNVHASLLPRWRGAAPVHRAIVAGDGVTGVTIMRVVLALDAGPMIARVSTPIEPNETSVQLEARLAAIGAEALVAVLADLEQGRTREIDQDECEATYAPKLERSDSPIDWSQPAASVHNRIRGLHPWPLASSTLRGQRLLLLRSTVADTAPTGAEPGTIVGVRPDALEIAARPGAIHLLELQPEGRRAMQTRDFLNGTRLTPGERFR